ncbi:SLC13 family permease [Georgenia subflava]|uniref:SLC13 family permease n=1 Tax=Georgenia subflava TaxID=1622177 RepID=A0A6N7ENI2_9MICO|nr:SLC13 family permease [Georgenia subflava]MPV38427.1 SLC13 family permease [Georgenia subflava]
MTLDPAVTSLLVLAAAVAVFVWNRLPVGVVAVLTALALYATGLLDAGQALGGFGDPVVLFVAGLFVVSEGLDATGVTTWAGQAITGRAGTGRSALLVAVMVLAAVLTAFISPNGSVAALLPMVVVMAVRNGHAPGHMLLPLAFAAHAGSLLALSGSPVNVIVSDALADAGRGRFGYFSFAAVGLPLLVVTVILAVTVGPRLLPVRAGAAPTDLSGHARTLAGHYTAGSDVFRLLVGLGSSLTGTTVRDLSLEGARLVGVQTAAGGSATEGHRLADDDALVLAGPRAAVEEFAAAHDLAMGPGPVRPGPDDLLRREAGVVEVVVPPRSPLVGETVFPGMVRLGEITVLAVQHLGRDRGARPTRLTEGDALLLHGRWSAIDTLVDDRDILVVDAPSELRRQAVPLGLRAAEAVAVLAVMVVLLVTEAVPPAVASLGAAAAMVLLRVVSPHQAYRSVSWETVVLLGGLIPLSTAIQSTGAADLIAGHLIGAVGQGSPYLLLTALFVLTAALGQVVSNTATVLIVVPIAVVAALESGTAVEPVLMTVAVAGASSFLTPIATPANMMVMAPGGYRFGDYWRFGLPVLVAWLGVALLVIPLVWPL